MTPREKNTTAVLVLLSIFSLCVIGLFLVRCATRPPIDEPPPTLAISETPSLTPEPATSTPTITPPPSASATVVAVATLTAGMVTAVSPPPGMAVPPVPSATPTLPAPTATFVSTRFPVQYEVQPNDNLSWISQAFWGYQDWRCLYAMNEAIIKRPDYIFAGQVLVIDWPCN